MVLLLPPPPEAHTSINAMEPTDGFVHVPLELNVCSSIGSAGAAHDVTPDPFVTSACPFVPAVVGRVNDHVPAVAAGCTVTVPEVVPSNSTERTDAAPITSSRAVGDAVPIPTRLLVLSTFSVEVSTVMSPETTTVVVVKVLVPGFHDNDPSVFRPDAVPLVALKKTG